MCNGVLLERPKLQLQPRTRPKSGDGEDASRSSIFGQAKPVDTTAREKEIEERLLRQQEQQDKPRPSSRGESHRDSREDSRGDSRDSRGGSRSDSRSSRGSTSRMGDKEQAVKKVVKEAKPPPSTGNAWLKGKPRILEKQDDTPVRSILSVCS